MGQSCKSQGGGGQGSEIVGVDSRRNAGFFAQLQEHSSTFDEGTVDDMVAFEHSTLNDLEDTARSSCPSTWPVIKVDIFYREHMQLLRKAGLEFASWLDEAGGVKSTDTLLVVDMQNDFIPVKFAPGCGRASIPEGEAVLEPVIQLIEAFSRQNALIVATRAFHPPDHISFYDQGGQQPAHCVQTTPGADFYPSVAEALHQARTLPLWQSAGNGLPGQAGKVEIAFKGFLEDVASPGAFRYDREYFDERLKQYNWDLPDCSTKGVKSADMWTGAMALKCSNLINDINANPDLSALLQPDLRPLEEVVQRSGRLLIVGLALDTSILDTAVAAARLGYEKVFVAIDACRPSHFGITGEYGSGFLTDPKYLVSEFQKYNIKIVQSSEVLRDCCDSHKHLTGRSNSRGKGGG